MARSMTVQIVDAGGRFRRGARAGLVIHRGFGGSGLQMEHYSSADAGRTEIELGDGSRIILYVDGREVSQKERHWPSLSKCIV